MSNDLNSLEGEIEQTRERLASTIDELLHRTNPKTIARKEANAVKGYFVDATTGAPRTDNILKVVGGVAGAVAVVVVVRKLVK
ncbi:hypothetical protein QE364_003933 [Nocardioides zeae]|uniref:Uncharacterized protein n=2 Tax=Nocardioides zeae TaxID=1457234 RepID=A0ACC6INH6_9ACTN|nr:DUF3618 domain-containing protein [Nocardioides zeae]MDQ1102962.1 hypothetical protein [Nocardioides zeae]MDR6173304.1 hypothetical protein [Nocardioides zeae]MDR6212202.1 hypothetical protein [Nocardioides zeae]